MLALASNHLRSYLAPARRESNPSTLGTIAIVAVVGLVGYGIWRGVQGAKASIVKNLSGTIGDHRFTIKQTATKAFDWTVYKDDRIVASGVETTSQLAVAAVQDAIGISANDPSGVQIVEHAEGQTQDGEPWSASVYTSDPGSAHDWCFEGLVGEGNKDLRCALNYVQAYQLFKEFKTAMA